MARDPLYTSIENPIQFDRLPDQRPDVQFALRENKPELVNQFAGKQIAILASVGAVIAFVKTFDLDVAAATDGTFFSMLNIVIVTWALCYVGRTIRTGSLRRTGLPLICAASAYVYVMIPVNVVVQVALNATFLCLLSWCFAQHWAATCTAAPFHRKWAEQLHPQWNKFLYISAAIPPASAIAVIVTGSWLMPIVTVVAVVILQTIHTLMKWGPRPFGVVREAITSWLSYNRDDLDLPGILRSPAGGLAGRTVLTGATVAMTAITCVRFPREVFWPSAYANNDLTPWANNGASFLSEWFIEPFDTTLAGVYLALFTFLVIHLVPSIIALLLPPLLSLPVLMAASQCREERADASSWDEVVEDLNESSDPISRESLYLGRVKSDGSPFLAPFSVLDEHGHFLGDTGSGKTSRGLAPLLEQLIRYRDCTVIVIDLKADPGSMELLATLQAAAEWKRTHKGIHIPVKHFSSLSGMSTFACNPLTQDFWASADPYIKTDILGGALDLIYGAGFGESFFSSMNTALLHHTLKTYPETSSFKELSEHVGLVMRTKDRDLHQEVRKEAAHVHTVLSRLASFEAINVTTDSGHSDDVVNHAIDFASVFSQPQLHYYFLSSIYGTSSSPELARLITYSLIAAGNKVKRKHRVYLVIDEFQRMISQNLSLVLQQARSMGVSVILANQSMQDLKTSKVDMIPSIQSNCRYRQWFSVSNLKDQQELIAGSGETVDVMFSTGVSENGLRISESFQKTEQRAARVGINEVLLTSDNPDSSFVKLSRGAGYAQYGGMVTEVQSDYHITQAEYERRKSLPWPTEVTGSFMPRGEQGPDDFTSPVPRPPSPTSGPNVTTEVIGAEPASKGEQWRNPFESFAEPEPDAKKKKPRPRRNQK